jgi:hypothetical protein
MQQTYLFKTIVTVVILLEKKLLTNLMQILKKRPKFRIIKRRNKYISQEFFGFWKIGFYFNFGYYKRELFIPDSYKHDTMKEAEETIEKAMEETNIKEYVIKEYYN